MEEQQQTECTHTREERQLTGTWVTEEVKKAITLGYEIEVSYFLMVPQLT